MLDADSREGTCYPSNSSHGLWIFPETRQPDEGRFSFLARRFSGKLNACYPLCPAAVFCKRSLDPVP